MSNIRNFLAIGFLFIIILVVIGFISLWLMAGVVIGLLFGALIGASLVGNLSSAKIVEILNKVNLDTKIASEALAFIGATKNDNLAQMRTKYKLKLAELDNEEGKTELEIKEDDDYRKKLKESFELILKLQNWEELNNSIEQEENKQEEFLRKQLEEQEIIEAYRASKEANAMDAAHADLAKQKEEQQHKSEILNAINAHKKKEEQENKQFNVN